MEKATNIGENLFFRGGISDDINAACGTDPNCQGTVQPTDCPCAMHIQVY